MLGLILIYVSKRGFWWISEGLENAEHRFEVWILSLWIGALSSSCMRVVWKRRSHEMPLQWRLNGLDGVSNQQPHHCLLSRLFGHRSKKTSKLRVTDLYAGNSPGTGEFPAQRASNAENVSIWWRHHAYRVYSQHDILKSVDHRKCFLGIITTYCVEELNGNWFLHSRRRGAVWAGRWRWWPRARTSSSIQSGIHCTPDKDHGSSMCMVAWWPTYSRLDACNGKTEIPSPGEDHGVLNQRRNDSFFNSLFKVIARKISKLHIAGTLWRESIGHWWIPLTK